EGSMGGFKEIVAEIRGRGAFAKLKYESGVHRVQRVPETEGSGRIHTSTATVAVLPEAEDLDVAINDTDLKIDTLRSSGAGGQHVNKTESAVRVTHIPSGIVVMMQEDRSQHRNRAKALAVLRTRLYDLQRQKQDAARAAERRGQVGSGDRSERIRTYNFPQGRVSDHRINLTLYKLPQIIEGEALGEIIDALVTENQAELLAAEGGWTFSSSTGSGFLRSSPRRRGPRRRGRQPFDSGSPPSRGRTEWAARQGTEECREIAGAALLPALAYSSRDGSIDVIGQKPRRQESLVHELGGGIGDAGAVFGMRQSLARLEQSKPRPGLRQRFPAVPDSIAVHVDEPAAPVERLEVAAVEGRKARLLVGPARG